MSSFMEFEGRNVEQAVFNASKLLHIPKEQIKHDIISVGSTGIFGLVGIKKARIRVVLPELADTHELEKLNDSDSDSELPVALNDVAVESELLMRTDLIVKSDSECLPEDPVDRGYFVLQKILDLITVDSEITLENNNRQVVYTIRGEKLFTVMGKRGQTLEAIQFLLNKIINKSSENKFRVLVHIDGYLSKRQNDLQQHAARLAEKVCKNGKPVIVGKFNPQDRKFIHIALRNDPRVTTQSSGEGYLKKIVIYPQKLQQPESLMSET